METKSYQEAIESCKYSLEKLQLDFVDLYLSHAPFAQDDRLKQWEAFADLKSQGKVRAIGVSNYRESHIEEIRASELPMPQVKQVELHPWSQKPGLVAFLAENDIAITAHSSLIPLSTWRIEEGQDSAKTEAMKAEGAKTGSPFKTMADKYGVSEAQVLLRWGVQNGYAILPKSSNEERSRQNFDLFSFEIDDDDVAAIALMDRGDGLAWAHGDPSVVVWNGPAWRRQLSSDG